MIGMIGIGNMGKALTIALLNQIKKNQSLMIYSRNSLQYQFFKKNLQIKIAENITEIFRNCETIFLCIKPKDAKNFFKENCQYLNPQHKIISIMAGVSIVQLKAMVSRKNLLPKLIRIMPNLASQIGQGTGGFCFSNNLNQIEKNQIINLFSAFGNYLEIKESLFDAMTVVSGCGPAFVFLFIEALADAGNKLGLSRKQALSLANLTLIGSAQLVRENGNPIALKNQVTSPGGMTIEGVNWLEKNNFHKITGEALQLAFKKAKKLTGKK